MELGIGILEVLREEVEETKAGMWRARWEEGRLGDIVSF